MMIIKAAFIFLITLSCHQNCLMTTLHVWTKTRLVILWEHCKPTKIKMAYSLKRLYCKTIQKCCKQCNVNVCCIFHIRWVILIWLNSKILYWTYCHSWPEPTTWFPHLSITTFAYTIFAKVTYSFNCVLSNIQDTHQP